MCGFSTVRFVVDGFDPVNLLQRADKCIREPVRTQMTVAASGSVSSAYGWRGAPGGRAERRVVSGTVAATLHSYTNSHTSKVIMRSTIEASDLGKTFATKAIR